MPKKLVIGGSGFVGSNVIRKLVERGDDVRVMLRKTSSTRAIDDLEVERCYGDVFDDEALQVAMADCDVVYYCVVDARAWLRDPAPLIRTNVEGLRHVLDAAVDTELRRFVFMSTIATLAVSTDGTPVTEDQPCNWYADGGAYTQCRVDAENLVLQYANEKGLPAVALCISNTYGPRDWQPTPHGGLIAMIAAGKAPFYFRGIGQEVVGIEDAAEAMILASEKGRVGERYIISDRFLTTRELHTLAAEAGGVRPPWLPIPRRVLLALSSVAQLAGDLTGREIKFARRAFNMVDKMSALDHGKAERELGWKPAPIEDSIRDAVAFYRAHDMM
ncbi:NAD-dependent epimerase/dehydratase family protein [Mycolicibacterium diernhoferi]|uniref:NAD-dependent dehydratase n=1 Tax=Mycolicibacterium diernhoferi TaxID=1801 RepID=A0A1Q4HFZ7_9MYCO|nr:NAD-dependent epimerase/dehydratase family protein [Mycolicibacterium diernhoferi]OJZ66437.1 NAD-dependent dehydratase [Mycolicibacterium diernhoferi]OPE56361.1 NAD-dependent dehydratase [Mycolicibacterium diernhoferi]PEG56313.1 NAD-dependent dehydratase [Mycolicibacterium diernhoferi]QYL24610.1 NAD-dependent epimerase/dehydratase family protein [Mycolicibacterium diernhoferi]